MSEESMVERVARAICAATGTIWGGPRGDDDPDFLLVKLMYLNQARAAIEAMREPTDAMVDAAYDWLSDTAPLTGRRTTDIAGTFKFMIDAALKGPA